MFRLGSLFSGSGGFELAGAINGIEPVWASEIEKYPVAVTTARFPHMKHLGSILDVDGSKVEPVDIITFGSPCQDLSVAGKQAGLHKGERSNLFFEAIRIIKEMREATNGIYPRIAIWENVPGAYSSNKGEDFRAVLQAFCSVKDETADVPRPAAGKWKPAGAIVGNGWSIAWRTFDAQYWGVPQRRKRIYLIADFGSERAGEILFEQEGLRGHSAESGTAGQGAAGDAQGSAGRGCAYGLTTKGNGEAFISEELHAALSCGGGQAGQGYPAIIYSATQQSGTAREGTADNAEGSVGRSSGAIVFKERAGKPGGGKGILCGDKPFTLSTLTDQAVCYAVDGYNSAMDENAATLGVNCGLSTGRNGVVYPIDLIRESRGAFEAYEQDADKAGSLKQCDNKGSQVVCYPINTMVATRWKADDGRTTFGIGDNGDPQFTIGAAHEHAVCYAAGFKYGNSAQAHGIGWQDEVSPTLQAGEGGNQKPVVCYVLQGNGIDRADTAGCNGAGWRENECYTLNTIDRPAVCCQNKVGALCADDYKGINQQYVGQDKVVCYPIDSHQQDSRFKICEDGVCPTVPGQMGTGGNNGPMVMTYRKTAHPRTSDEGQGWEETDKADTLNVFDNSETRTPTAVVFSAGNGQLHQALEPELAGPLDCMHDQKIVLHPSKPPRRYIIRRLTPLECCRLQGFPDYWCSDLGIENPTEDDIAFWTEVWETHRKINGVSKKPKSRKQIIKWLQNPHSDSAEYKMWGNGIALPNAEFVVRQAKQLLTSK